MKTHFFFSWLIFWQVVAAWVGGVLIGAFVTRGGLKVKRLTFEFFTDKGKKWRFRIVAGNGEILATSEAYSSKAKAVNGMNAIIEARDIRFVGIEQEKRVGKK